MLAYSSGNGASYQVLISWAPNRIVLMRRVGGSVLVVRSPPGVEGVGESEVGEKGIWLSVLERRGREEGPATGSSSGFSENRRGRGASFS